MIVAYKLFLIRVIPSGPIPSLTEDKNYLIAWPASLLQWTCIRVVIVQYACLIKATVWKSFDRIGMTLSMACAIHCLAMPLLLPLIRFFLGGWDHRIGYRYHNSFDCGPYPLMCILKAPEAQGACHACSWALAWTPRRTFAFCICCLGRFSLAIGHWVNLKLCKSCPSCKEEDSIRYCD